MSNPLPPIPGTTPFDGEQARKGYALNKMPTFAMGAAPEYSNADEGWGIPTLPPFKGELDLSWHIITTLVEKEFDLQFLDSLESNPEWITQFSVHELVEKTGTQGVELLMWVAMRGALAAAGGAKVQRVTGNYHIPISNTATAVLALEVA